MKPETLKQARRVIDAVLRERHGEVKFVKISVNSDVDEDGDEFLWVKAVYDGQPKNIDTEKATSMVRHLRPKLEEVDVEAFPVISYIAKSDLKKRELEAI